MPGLTAAHRGYEYQDLLAAARLVDLLLGSLVSVHVDEKLVDGDLFDDLTTVDIEGVRERVQFKHRDNDDLPLTISTFTGDTRDLALDRLVAAAIADRDGPGKDARRHLFRVVLRDGRPVDETLLRVLRPANPDPGPFLSTMSTTRWRFDPLTLWAEADRNGPFRFLKAGARTVDQADLAWLCERLVIEVEAPSASGDLTGPGPAEHLLLSRVRLDVGAELYPNADRSAVDVAEAVIRTARAARQGRIHVTADELLRRARLRHDFGAVARAHPVDRAVEVSRRTSIGELAAAVHRASDGQKPLLIVGPPGQGKSWACHQLIEQVVSEGWLVAEHYCYLGDADGEKLERVLAESVFGSLLGRVADADPGAVADQRPRLAADEQALEAALSKVRGRRPDRPVALVVDGLDHVTRVRQPSGTWDPSLALAEALSMLELPAGCVLIVLSQPGEHLRPLEEAGSVRIELPALDEAELRELATRLGVLPSDAGDESSLITDPADVDPFLAVLEERSRGNALYATYLCREAQLHVALVADPAAVVRDLPSFDGTLETYYRHVQASLGAQAAWVADVIALVDFAVTRAELKEIRPDLAHRVDEALSVLRPVLIERATQGGVRIYHESFARFLRQPFQGDRIALVALLDRLATWLTSRGMFDDPRAFRSLLPILADAGHDQSVVDLVGRDFVVRGVAGGFPPSAMTLNLAIALRCAARAGNWPAVVRYVELARAAETYQDERFDSTLVEFADVPMAVLGPDTFADRLLHDGRTVIAARAGLQMCAAVDTLGGVAPWRQYMEAYRREAEGDNTSYGDESERAVAVAWLRGRLRLSAIAGGSEDLHDAIERTPGASDPSGRGDPTSPNGETQPTIEVAAPIDWDRLAGHVEEAKLPLGAVVTAIADTYGASILGDLARRFTRQGDFCLEVARQVASGRLVDTGLPASDWAKNAVEHGVRVGAANELIDLGVDPRDLDAEPIADLRARLLTLTREAQRPSVHWESGIIGEWLDACAIAARRDALGLDAVHALIQGPGWYPCWLRFVVALTRAEASPTHHQSRLAIAALQHLREDLDPFAGDPRSCDLYSIHGTIEVTIRRAISLLDDDGWATAIHLLAEVSQAITTSLFGELGGPVPPDRLLALSIETAGPTRFASAEALTREEIENGAARRFYSDLAAYRLLAARVALAKADLAEAMRWWSDACQMLTGYGWHKDITIYELLDPLPHLITRDPGRGRARVAAVQGLCERVPMHTDLKETRGAWSTWWSLLAQADPSAVAGLAAPALLARCNDPNDLLHRARLYLWRNWHSRADPIMAGALRLTLDTPLDSEDPVSVMRLAGLTDGTGTDLAERMMTLLLARADERPTQYSYTNGDELLAQDNALVAELNRAADVAQLSPVMPAPDPSASTRPHRFPERAANRSDDDLQAALDSGVRRLFAPGAVGLARAIRTWRQRGYGRDGHFSVDGMANAIGYRLAELADSGRDHEAAAALRLLSDAGGLGDRSGLLPALAQGLERLGHRTLAAQAHALAWTRARGRGGWLTFGGETEVESLRAAARIDRDVALSVIAAEAEQVLARGRYGTYGMTQALIYAFAAVDLTGSAPAGLDIAFRAWDEACAVVSGRAPRVHPSDDPTEVYTPLEPDAGAATSGNLDAAFAVATLAGLAHPARENKRRSLLAVRALIDGRPKEAAPAFSVALTHLSDPATLTWLLRLLESAGPHREDVVEACLQALRTRADDPHLTVRALARRLLGDRSESGPPASSPDPELIRKARESLWTPAQDDAPANPKLLGLHEFIDLVAGQRIARGERVLEGFRLAVRARVANAVSQASYEARLKAQLDAYADRIEKRWPDAFLASEEVIEDAMQLVASGGRGARLASGSPIADPLAWEDDLASALLEDPWLPLAIEATRQPRPAIPAPPTGGDSIWQTVSADADSEFGTDPHGEDASDDEGLLMGTVSTESAQLASSITRGAFSGWRVLATVETRTFKSPDRRREDDATARRYRAIEVRLPGDRQALGVPPMAVGDLRTWLEHVPTLLYGRDALRKSQPLVAMDADIDPFEDAKRGLGVPNPLLAVTAPFVASLGLRPGQPFVLEDSAGRATLTLVTWRSEYETSEYHLPWARLRGAAVLLRGDLFVELVALADEHLVLRDFIVGDSRLARG